MPVSILTNRCFDTSHTWYDLFKPALGVDIGALEAEVEACRKNITRSHFIPRVPKTGTNHISQTGATVPTTVRESSQAFYD